MDAGHSWSIDYEDIRLSEIEYAFDQAKLFYRNGQNKDNYSEGAIYHYFHDKYNEKLLEMYDKIASVSAIKDCKRPGHIIWDTKKESYNDELKNIIKSYENIYSSKTIMDYLLEANNKDFQPRMNYGFERKDYNWGLVDTLEKNTGRYLQKGNTAVLYEMIVQRRFVERKANVIESHYGTSIIDQILSVLQENEKNNAAVGSIADYSAFMLVSCFADYFKAIYVFTVN